jgi:hypothetical protein
MLYHKKLPLDWKIIEYVDDKEVRAFTYDSELNIVEFFSAYYSDGYWRMWQDVGFSLYCEELDNFIRTVNKERQLNGKDSL